MEFDTTTILNVIVLGVLAVVVYIYFLKPTPPPPPKPTPGSPQAKQPAKQPVKQPAKPASKVAAAPIEPKVYEKKPLSKAFKILFGSQTGTAEDFSHTLAKEARKLGLVPQVVDLERYDPDELQSEAFIIYLTATHGEGSPPDNAKIFYNWLLSPDRPANLLTNVSFSVFGLGNKTYEHYNKCARDVDRRLEELGARRVYARGEGDDDASLEDDFNRWKKDLWEPVCRHLGVEMQKLGASSDDKFAPRLRLVELQSLEDAAARFPASPPKTLPDGSVVYDMKRPYLALVTENRELHTPQSDRSCRHVEMDIGPLTYEAGDHLGVYPVNDTEIVRALAHRLRIDNLDVPIVLVPQNPKDGEEPVLGPCTVGEALGRKVDILTPPRRSVIAALAEFAQNFEEKKRLAFLGSDAGSEEYNKHVKSDMRTILEILDEFPSVVLPLAVFIELMPALAPRYYSISSSYNLHPGRVHITSVVVHYETGTGRHHKGVCSTWLAKLRVGDAVPVFTKQSHFKLPKNPTDPIIMVGPGTGVAPFRGFLQELKWRQQQGQPIGASVLFFGCRSRHHDFLYENELLAHGRDKTLHHLNVAFSREQEKKQYVQHKMVESKDIIWDFLQQGASFYVCGDAREMAKQVHQALLTIIEECGGMSAQRATEFVEQMQQTGKYQTDVWF